MADFTITTAPRLSDYDPHTSGELQARMGFRYDWDLDNGSGEAGGAIDTTNWPTNNLRKTERCVVAGAKLDADNGRLDYVIISGRLADPAEINPDTHPDVPSRVVVTVKNAAGTVIHTVDTGEKTSDGVTNRWNLQKIPTEEADGMPKTKDVLPVYIRFYGMYNRDNDGNPAAEAPPEFDYTAVGGGSIEVTFS